MFAIFPTNFVIYILVLDGKMKGLFWLKMLPGSLPIQTFHLLCEEKPNLFLFHLLKVEIQR